VKAFRLSQAVVDHIAEDFDPADDVVGDEEYLQRARVLRALIAGEAVERASAVRALHEAANACDDRLVEGKLDGYERQHQARMRDALTAAAYRYAAR
jgi:hypothetical protein